MNESNMTHNLTHIFLLLAVISCTSLIPVTDKHFSDYLPPPEIGLSSCSNHPWHHVKLYLSNKIKKSKDDNDFSMDLFHKVASHIAIPLAQMLMLIFIIIPSKMECFLKIWKYPESYLFIFLNQKTPWTLKIIEFC